tara:strand:- start:6060 stop:6746 length:687 start_codon:yes stop_codon:yes gene_type:complete
LDITIEKSFCPKCKKKIAWYDNIPLLSSLILSFKCRTCKKKISKQYFIVELFTGLAFMFFYKTLGLGFDFILVCIIFLILLIIFFIDLKHYIIPDSLNFSLILIGILKNFTTQDLLKFNYNLPDSLLGGALGYLIIWLIIFIYKKIRNKEAMGLGDAKLLSAFGFLLGFQALLPIVFIASLTGLIYVLPSLIINKKNLQNIIPFGPFIIISGIIYYFCAESIFLLLKI